MTGISIPGSKKILLGESGREEIRAARDELNDSLNKILSAIKDNESVQSLAKNLSEKGFWDALTGAFGRNDRDLAQMMRQLGKSVETTQEVVQVILHLQTRKHHFLREFHDVLVDKIQKIQADTHTLNCNQRESAIAILSELQDQIEDQLRHHEMVDRHEAKISEFAEAVTRFENDLARHAEVLQDRSADFQYASDCLSREVNFLRTELTVVGERALVEASALNTRLESVEALKQRLWLIEATLLAESSWKGQLARHAVAIVSLIVSLLAITLKHG